MIGQEDYEQQIQQMDIEHPTGRGVWWIFVLKKGVYTNIGYELSESEATDRAYRECSDYHWELRKYNTTNTAEAQRRFKYDRLSQTHNLDLATQRMIRKPANEQKKKQEDDDENWASIDGF